MPESNWAYDADLYCEQCLPVSIHHPGVADGSGEQDSPAHCCGCGRPLDYSLTTEGVAYVIDRIRESLRTREHLSSTTIDHDHAPAYYKGSPIYAITRDWAEDLSWYNLSVKDENLVRRYLELTAPKVV